MDNIDELVYEIFEWIKENVPLTNDELYLADRITIAAFDKLNPRQEGE